MGEPLGALVVDAGRYAAPQNGGRGACRPFQSRSTVEREQVAGCDTSDARRHDS
jgi:hypothetical protein